MEAMTFPGYIRGITKGFGAVKQNVLTVLSGTRGERKKSRKREHYVAIWNSNPCLPVLSSSSEVSPGVSGRKIENAEYTKISLFPGQG